MESHPALDGQPNRSLFRKSTDTVCYKLAGSDPIRTGASGTRYHVNSWEGLRGRGTWQDVRRLNRNRATRRVA